MRARVLIFVLMAALCSGCVTASVVPDWLGWLPGSTTKGELCADSPESSKCGDIKPATLFFAVAADYTRAKRAAVVYAESDFADPGVVDEIINIVQKGDAELEGVINDWHAGRASDSQYTKAIRVLRGLVIRLNAKAAQGELTR